MSVRSLAKYWIPVLAWMLVIFLASGDLMSAEHTSRFLVPFLRWICPEISDATVASIQFALRKLGHLTEYAVLAALLWRALRNTRNLRAKMSTLFVGVWVACAILAATDEFHQSFIASRTASPYDVLIDICGALIGIVLCLIFSRRRLTSKR